MRNAHIFQYLDYFIELEKPGFAVMLTGPWGIGKSFNVRRYIDAVRKRGKKVAYVSLYGINSTDDIVVLLLASMIAPDKSVLAKLGGQIGRVLVSRFASGAGEQITGWLPDSFSDVVVLDDIERAQMPAVEILGFVNSFVEHEGRRVVLIANEAEINDLSAYLRVREKVIGMTFELVEEADAALDHFIGALSDPGTRDFIKGQRDATLQIFARSGTQNLRVLDQSLRAWARVFKVVDPTLRSKDSGMATAYKLFLALALEVRTGRLSREDLTGRVDHIVAGRGDGDVPGRPLAVAQDRYKRLPLHDSIISDEVLVGVLFDGRIDASVINQTLSVHETFVEPDEEPNWRKVWHGFLREADEFEAAFAAMEQEVLERRFEDPGEVLHVLGMRLWGVELGELDKTEQEVVAEGKAYIEDLRASGRLLRYQPRDFREASHGLSFHKGESAAFQELQNYMIEQGELAYEATWPALAQTLLRDMEGDAERFFRRICWTSGPQKPDCADDAILAKMDPEAFVVQLVNATPSAQRTILQGLNERYETGRLADLLAPERFWLVAMNNHLQSRLPGLSRIRRYSIGHDVERLLGRALASAHRGIDAQGGAGGDT